MPVVQKVFSENNHGHDFVLMGLFRTFVWIGEMGFLQRKNALTDILVSGAGSMAAPLINFAAIPLVLRIYGPADYGNWILVMSFAIILGNISTLRYELALVLAEDDGETGEILSLCLALIAIVTGLAVIGVVVSRLWIGSVPFLMGIQTHLWAVPLLTSLIGLSWVGRSYCTRQRAFIYNSLSFVVFAGFTNAIQILAPKFGLSGSSGLLFGSIVGWSGAAIVLMWGGFRNSSREMWRGMINPGFAKHARKYSNFPRFTVPYTFIGTLRLEGVKLLLGSFGSSALVGDFSFAQRLTNFPVTLFCGGIRPVLFQKAARSDEGAPLELFIRRIILILILVALPLVVLFEIKADAIFDLLVGHMWAGSVPYARILVLPAMGMMFFGWLDRMFDVKGRQDLALILQIVFTVLGLIGFCIGLLLLNNPLMAVLIQGLVTFLYLSIAVLAVYRIFGFPISKLRDLLFFPVALVLFVTISWRLFGPTMGEWGALVVGVILAWLVGVIYLRRTIFRSD